jgi:hypothetical protein
MVCRRPASGDGISRPDGRGFGLNGRQFNSVAKLPQCGYVRQAVFFVEQRDMSDMPGRAPPEIPIPHLNVNATAPRRPLIAKGIAASSDA